MLIAFQCFVDTNSLYIVYHVRIQLPIMITVFIYKRTHIIFISYTKAKDSRTAIAVGKLELKKNTTINQL